MNFLIPMYAVLLTVFAFAVIATMSLWQPSRSAVGRFMSIDGLRGYLAFFVFLHHAAIWFAYSRTGLWRVPESNLFTQLGESSVSLFFMITSFLFYNKLMESRQKRFDWIEFFVGRLFRLTPLYLVAMGLLFSIVLLLSDGVLIDSAKYVAKCVSQWITFSVFGEPDINRVPTRVIVAGVTWSLPYEWCFYLVLPLLALTTGRKVPFVLTIIAIGAVGFAIYDRMEPHMAMVFLGGILGTFTIRNAKFVAFAQTSLGSILVLICLASLTLFRTAYALTPLFLLIIAFCLIASGADIFGILRRETSRRFGELAYSIYLLHGILLYVALKLGVGRPTIAAMRGETYWLVIASLVPVLLAFASVTFRYIEEPGIAFGKSLMRYRRVVKERNGVRSGAA